jgi:hypothetical protein
VKDLDGRGPLVSGESIVSLVSFHSGHKYLHADVIEARFLGQDDHYDGRWEITKRLKGGSYYGQSHAYSIPQRLMGEPDGAQELREWVNALNAITNAHHVTNTMFCPLYQSFRWDEESLGNVHEDKLIEKLNWLTSDGGRYPGCPSQAFEICPTKPNDSGKQYPYGLTDSRLIEFLHSFLSCGGKSEVINKQELCDATGHDQEIIAQFIENGAVPIISGYSTAFDCLQLARFLARAYTKCWNGVRFVWGNTWKIERGNKPGALRIGDEDWYEVNYEARGPGVYLLFKDDKLKYVGESKCVVQRVGNHCKNPIWGDFDLALYRSVDCSMRRQMERHYTRALCPQFDPHRYGAHN